MAKRNPIPVDIGDGVPRELKLTITATNQLQEQFGTLEEMMKLKTKDILPGCLFAALVDKDGLTPQKIADTIELADVVPLWHTFLHAMTRVDIAAQVKAAEEKAALEATEAAANPTTNPEGEGKNEQIQPTTT